ncbi:HIG1 domain family member 1A, mitochondrial-like [Microplitis mediator]|uniref:HIG1 domain family member 1A, mitochondrial-like n=1 Tax=Microplitis mediator TaxID=375433 RepID=UPI002557B1F3|nr:HIG1 domain family member 1A, mitochondrial-like [Microplitis mediator]XP_057334471.1 HIG1 domain family member 1A, mitochondrial-like [Microplitis mediator]
MQDNRDFDDDQSSQKMLKSLTKNPFLLVGVAGFLATAGIGGYRFFTRPKGSPASLFLIQLRVTAQSVVIGSLTVGMVYGMVDHWILNPRIKKTDIAVGENK